MVFVGPGDSLLQKYHMSSHRLERDEQRRGRFRINTILRWTENLYDEISDRNITMELEDTEMTKSLGTPEFAYFRYFQYLKPKDDESTVGVFELRNRIIMTEQTYYRYIRYPKMNFVTVRAYSNYSQNRKMKDPELITRYQLLRKKTATTKIDVTQAGSE